ncbi:MAG TPA: aminotransferase class I/II-fold pyridoxal phosphate-dependent enzyme [Chitinophagaceae bacterium]|nr:aminotransferase class I/II-fold pyridoxal phosphate-dependent enzyme [Chitinophagaceae bacterium]
MIQPAPRLRHIEEYYFSTKLREIDQMNAEGKDVINLGIGSPDMAPHPDVIRQLSATAALPSSHGYQGYKGIAALRKAFSEFYARWYRVSLDPETEILPLLGSKEGIMHVSMAFLGAGDQVLVPNPGYPTYRAAALLCGADCREYPLGEAGHWFPDLEELSRQGLEKVKLMWVNYPNMPAGARASYGDFERLVAFGKAHRILICHDNPYSFILNDKPASLLEVPGALDHALELNSLSKSHNMAGWRVGMLAAKKEIITEVLRFKSNMDSGMFLPVQQAAVTALGLEKEWFNSLQEAYRERREQVFRLLDIAGCTYDPDQSGLFVWAKIPILYADGYALSDALLNGAGVFVTPGGIFGSKGSGYVRVSLCRGLPQLEKAMKRVEALNLKQPVG